jgi:transcriptional regulator
MLRAIVGIEVHITHLEGKRKLSQNRGTADRSGVMAALHERDHRALAQAMQQTG